jgi:protein phosphatase
MGSTISLVLIREGVAHIGNIGDSRVYFDRDGVLKQLTRDDAVISNLIEAGQITPEEAKTHPLRNLLTLSLGIAPDVEVHSSQLTLQPADRLLLCSDGLHSLVADADVKRVIESREEPQAATAELVDMAKKLGGLDNVSCIVLHCL